MADVLVVDDDTDVSELLTLVLEAQGHHVRRANDGHQGLRRVNEHNPDVVILDVEMPKLSGPEMAYEMLLQDAGKDLIPIVLVSGIADLPTVAARLGTPYFVSKPYDAATLTATLGRALRERRPPRPPSRATSRAA
jgi:DNA-binding NtrC family response regulator